MYCPASSLRTSYTIINVLTQQAATATTTTTIALFCLQRRMRYMEQVGNGRLHKSTPVVALHIKFPYGICYAFCFDFVMLISLDRHKHSHTQTLFFFSISPRSKQIETVADEASSFQFINITLLSDRHTIITTSAKIGHAFVGASLFSMCSSLFPRESKRNSCTHTYASHSRRQTNVNKIATKLK